jgi:hypothetical protein
MHSLRIALWAIFFIFCAQVTFAQKTFNVASGEWNVGGNWNPVGVPGIGDAVTIPAGRAITVSGTGNQCASIAFTGGASNSSITFSTGGELNVVGLINMTDPTAASISQTIDVADALLTCGSLTMANTSAATEKNRLLISTGRVTITGAFTPNGGGVGENELIFSGTGTLAVGGAFGLGTNDTFTPSTGTIEINGSVAQTLGGANTFNRLVISNTNTATISAAIFATRLICRNAGTKSIRGTITDLEIESGSTADVTNSLQVNDSIIISGTMTHTVTTGTKTYVGKVYIAPSGSWTNTGNEAFALRGGITNEGSFSSGTGTYTFNTNSQELRSTTALIFAGAVSISSPTIITNIDSVSITGTFTVATGAGWTNNANSKLRLAGTATLNASTLNFSAVPNTLHYAGAGAQSLLAGVTCNLLKKSGAGALTLNNNITINDRLIIEAGSVTCGANTIDLNGNLIGAGTLIQGAGGTFRISGENLHTGTFTAGTSTFTYDGAAQNIRAVTYNSLRIDGSDLKSLVGNTTVNGTLTLTAGTLVIGSNTLTLAGLIAGTSFIRGSGTSNLSITGATANTTINLDQTSASTRSINNFVMSRTNGTTLGNAFELIGTLTISNGTLTTGGNLTIISTSGATGRIAAIASGGISGNITVQRFIPGGENKRKWRFISSPVNVSGSIAFTQLTDDIFVTGVGGSANGFDDCSFCSPSLRTYTESTAGAASVGWTNPAGISSTINTGLAFEVFIRGDRLQSDPFLLNTIPNDVVLDFVGAANTGAVVRSLSFTNNGTPTADGFNLVGNPYPSQIDWQSGSITKTNIANTFWAYSAQSANYGVWNGTLASGTNLVTNIIPIAQGFFVKATSAGATLNFAEAAKSASTGFNFFRDAGQTESPLLRLQALNSNYSDELIVAFDSAANWTANDPDDAPKFFNDRLSFYSKSSNQVNLTINVGPYPQAFSIADTINLSLFSNNDSTTEYTSHQIKVTQWRNIPASFNLVLRDNYSNINTDLRVDTIYNFSINTDPASYGNNRFDLIIQKISTGVNADIKKPFVLYPNPCADALHLQQINSNCTTKKYRIYNALGQMQVEGAIRTNHKTVVIDTEDLVDGIYTLELESCDETSSQKFIKINE